MAYGPGIDWTQNDWFADYRRDPCHCACRPPVIVIECHHTYPFPSMTSFSSCTKCGAPKPPPPVSTIT